MSDLAPLSNPSTWETIRSSTEFISAMVSLGISGGFSLLTRWLDGKDHLSKLTGERNYQKKLFYYQNTVLKIYESLSAFSYAYKSAIGDCVNDINKVSGITAAKKKKIVEATVEGLDKLNKEFEVDILPKARIISNGYSKALEEIWVNFYDDIVAQAASLTTGNFATKSLTIFSNVANRQEKFLMDLVVFTKAQHPEL